MKGFATGALQRVVEPAAAAFAVACLLFTAPAAALTATAALDVCPADADPCEVTQVIEVADDAVLDFGFRTVRVRGFGRFDFGANSGTIRCGSFDAETDKAAIDAAGPTTSGTFESGRVEIQAVRSCSVGDPVACIDDESCQLGACDARRCSLRPNRLCTSDLNCQLGACGTNQRCSASPTFVRCSTNADCDYGTCPAQLSCHNPSLQVVECASNSDCDRGSCSIGDGTLTMHGAIDGASDDPGAIVLRAAADVSITKPVNLSSSNDEADGGELEIQSGGSVSIAARMRATAGRDSQGGLVEIVAIDDIAIEDRVNVSGGDFDGGAFELYAGRDIRVNGHVIADSKAGAGFGGEILMVAGQDLILNENPDAGRIRISTSGHTNAENFSGDGGVQEYVAERDIIVGANVRLIGRGSKPDGFGMDLYADAGRDLGFAGDLVATSAGAQGGGGNVETTSGQSTTVAQSSKLLLAGGRAVEGDGGILDMESGGDFEFAGRTTQASFVSFDSEADLSITGKLHARGEVSVEACRLSLLDGSTVHNFDESATNYFTARESMYLLAGSQTIAAGDNVFIYRAAEKPPVIHGEVSPAPELRLDPVLEGCPVCGNSEIDEDEDCDDGNVVAGDGCDELCLSE